MQLPTTVIDEIEVVGEDGFSGRTDHTRLVGVVCCEHFRQWRRDGLSWLDHRGVCSQDCLSVHIFEIDF